MANINNIQALASKLNLQNLSKPDFDLCETDMSNLDYLEFILNKELEIRTEKQKKRYLRESKLPKKELDFNTLNEGARWQISELINNGFCLDRNLVVTGSCRTGKTALASFLGIEAVKKGLKVYYAKQDLLIEVLRSKNSEPKCKSVWSRFKATDMIIIDEMLYTNLSAEELNLLYKGLVFLSETHKLIFITNREISEWLSVATDKHLMQTLIDRLLRDVEMLRTNK